MRKLGLRYFCFHDADLVPEGDTLSETNAQAMATLAQMRAASLNQIYQTLTPEQRKKADELKNRFDRQTPRQSPPAPTGNDGAAGPATGICLKAHGLRTYLSRPRFPTRPADLVRARIDR